MSIVISSTRIFTEPQPTYTRELLDAIPLPEPDRGWLERGVPA